MNDKYLYNFYHPIGYCLSDSNENYVYFPIPKNASMHISMALNKIGFKDDKNWLNDSELKNKIPIIILRDPLERWISGMIEFIKRFNNRYNLDIDQQNTLRLLEEKMFDKIVFDVHTSPQYFFYDFLNFNNSIFFYINDTFSEKFYNFLSLNFKNTLTDLEYLKDNYVSSKRSNYSELNKIIYDFLSKDNRKEKIKSFYKKDYELINSLKFCNIDL